MRHNPEDSCPWFHLLHRPSPRKWCNQPDNCKDFLLSRRWHHRMGENNQVSRETGLHPVHRCYFHTPVDNLPDSFRESPSSRRIHLHSHHNLPGRQPGSRPLRTFHLRRQQDNPVDTCHRLARIRADHKFRRHTDHNLPDMSPDFPGRHTCRPHTLPGRSVRWHHTGKVLSGMHHSVCSRLHRHTRYRRPPGDRDTLRCHKYR